MVAEVDNVLVVHSQRAGAQREGADRLREGQSGQAQFLELRRRTSSHLAGELFKSLAGVEMQHVAYRGTGARAAGPARRDKVQMAIDSVATLLPQIKSGSCARSASRHRAQSDAAGRAADRRYAARFEARSINYINARAARRQPIVDRLNREISAVLCRAGDRAHGWSRWRQADDREPDALARASPGAGEVEEGDRADQVTLELKFHLPLEQIQPLASVIITLR